MLQHRYKGAINEHYVDKHGDKPTVETLLENTTIINRKSSKNLLYIAEAVAIEIRKPKLNVQKEFDYTLPSNRKPRRSTHGDTSHRPINAPGIDGGCKIPRPGLAGLVWAPRLRPSKLYSGVV